MLCKYLHYHLTTTNNDFFYIFYLYSYKVRVIFFGKASYMIYPTQPIVLSIYNAQG